VSEPTTSTAGNPPKKPGKKILGLNRTTVIVFGVALVAGIGWFLWKKHQASSAAATTAATAPTTDTSGTDNSGDLSAIQSELEQLLASEGAGGGQGAGSSGGGGTTTTTPVAEPTSPDVPAAPATTPTTSTGSTGTATAAKKAGAISNLQATNVGKTTATVKWNAAANATGGYAYKLTQMNGVLVKSGTTHATSVTLSGLHSKYEYNFGIQGLPGGPGDNIHFTTS
jgi:fibronectin type III domain protein